MGRGWRPLVVGAAVVVATFALAQAQVFAPSAPAEPRSGRETRRAASRSSPGSARAATATAGPAVSARRSSTRASPRRTSSAVVQQGRGVMPAGIVSGQEQADVVAYVVSISTPSS